MSELTTIDFPATPEAAVPTLRKIVLFGPPSLYYGALKCLIESRLSNVSVGCIMDEPSLLTSDAHVVVCDHDLEHVSQAGIAELTSLLQKVAPRPVLLITGGVHPSVLQQLLRDGMAGVVMRSSPCETLLEAIESVAGGKVWLQRDLLAETLGESSHVRRTCSEAHRVAQLTQREREIVAIAACGLTNRQIGARVHISEATVRHHLSSIFNKLGVANRGELIIFAFRHGLADAERELLC